MNVYSRNEFRFKNHRLLAEYLRELLGKSGEARSFVKEALRLFAETGKNEFEFNGTTLTLKEIAIACLVILNREPMGFFMNWNFLIEGNAEHTKSVFRKLEDYLESIPGVKLPKRDRKITRWLKRNEKTAKQKGGSDEED